MKEQHINVCTAGVKLRNTLCSDSCMLQVGYVQICRGEGGCHKSEKMKLVKIKGCKR